MNKPTQRRVIGIRHRVKRTTEGESRPTQLVIKVGDRLTKVNLATEEDEFAFLREQLQPHDICLMSLGGSGDRLAFAISRRMEDSEGCLLRLPPRLLKEYRERTGADKDDDARLLIEQFDQDAKPFVAVEPRDRKMISAREAYRSWVDAMKARIACEQRIHTSLIGQIYCSEEGGFPEGKIEQLYEQEKANNLTLRTLIGEEEEREKELVAALKQLRIYNELFMPIKGVGPKIAGRIITAIGDIRLFIVEPDHEDLKRLKDQSDEIERTVFAPLKKELAGEFAKRERNWKGKSSAEITFLQLGAAAQWLRQHNRHDEAAMLQEAIELHQQRSLLRRRAREKSKAKLRAFCGVHLLNDSAQCGNCLHVWKVDQAKLGTEVHSCPSCGDANIRAHGSFPRKRRGVTCNWNPQVRQAMYLLGDQFNRRPDTVWGKLLRERKAMLREKYPEPIEVSGKKRYSPAHIHRMGTWKTLSKFVDWLFDEWCRIEHVSV